MDLRADQQVLGGLASAASPAPGVPDDSYKKNGALVMLKPTGRYTVGQPGGNGTVETAGVHGKATEYVGNGAGVRWCRRSHGRESTLWVDGGCSTVVVLLFCRDRKLECARSEECLPGPKTGEQGVRAAPQQWEGRVQRDKRTCHGCVSRDGAPVVS